MREIKFRAWKPHNTLRMKPGMYQVNDIVWYDEPFQNNTGEVFYKGYKTSDYLEDIELMQYTGEKDKNGKEIYESDIIQPYMNGLKVEPQVIKYLQHGFMACDLDDTESMDGVWYYDMEVIGNVYQNKDLLK